MRRTSDLFTMNRILSSLRAFTGKAVAHPRRAKVELAST